MRLFVVAGGNLLVSCVGAWGGEGWIGDEVVWRGGG